jgi:hypothetical protein
MPGHGGAEAARPLGSSRPPIKRFATLVAAAALPYPSVQAKLPTPTPDGLVDAAGRLRPAKAE